MKNKNGKKLSDEEILLLQGLHKVILIESRLLNKKGFSRYNELLDQAEEENLLNEIKLNA